MTAFDFLGYAHRLQERGFRVVPPASDGSKKPTSILIPAECQHPACVEARADAAQRSQAPYGWIHLQHSPATADQLARWYRNGRTGIGFLTGHASAVGDGYAVEMLELEGRAVDADLLAELEQACAATGAGPILQRLRTGWEETTPSNGIHWYYGCTEVGPGQKLAKDADGQDLIETRSEGQFTIIAPSSGSVHKTGRPWTLVTGGPDTMPVLTPTERQTLLDTCAMLDRRGGETSNPESIDWASIVEGPTTPSSGSWMDDVIADYNRRTAWAEVLAGHFEYHHTKGSVDYWHFVGAENVIGATTNATGRDTLIVFSGTAAGKGWSVYEGQRPCPSYDRFAAHVVIETEREDVGARTETARRLRDAGYGPPATAPPWTPPPPDADLTSFLPPDLIEFCDAGDADYHWAIEGLAERGDRIILTGIEGQGKSTLLRQMAVQVAAGLHPFTLSDIEPLKVLYVDCENSERQVRRKLRPLRELVKDRYEAGRLRVHVVKDALELSRPEVFNALALRVEAQKPDIIIIGPLYKMVVGDPVKEEPANALAGALDRLRHLHDSALFVEAHSPYAESSRTHRPTRPYGASLWSRWPEFGLYLAPDGELAHWRGPRDERAWPKRLQRGQPWSWMPVGGEDLESARASWDGPTECMAAIMAWFGEHPTEEVSKRRMADKLRALGLNYRDRTISQSLEILAGRGDLAWRLGPRNSDLYRLNPGLLGLDEMDGDGPSRRPRPTAAHRVPAALGRGEGLTAAHRGPAPVRSTGGAGDAVKHLPAPEPVNTEVSDSGPRSEQPAPSEPPRQSWLWADPGGAP